MLEATRITATFGYPLRKAQTIAAYTQFEILRLDAVAAHDAVVDLFEVDAEQTVVDHVVFDHVVIATYIEAGVVGIVRVAGTGQSQAANDRIAGIQHHDRPLVAGINGHLAAAVNGNWLVDGYRASVDAGRRFQDGARRCFVNSFYLQRYTPLYQKK